MVCNDLLYLILHPALWSLDVMAGSLAAILDTDDKSFTLEMTERCMNWQEELPIKVETDNL